LDERTRELAQARQEAEEAKRLKTEFLARMSHDLRTPMNAIVGYARILLRKTREDLDERQYRNLENIQTSAHHLLDLINDILDLSKVEAGRVEVHPEEVDLNRLFYECLAWVAPKVREGVELEQEIEGGECLRTDPDRLRRALKNLLDNAARYTEKGRIRLVAKGNGEKVSIAVEDTGTGIPEADLAHIFDEFRQVARKGRTAEQGTGLGLAIVRRSVELLGGASRRRVVRGGDRRLRSSCRWIFQGEPDFRIFFSNEKIDAVLQRQGDKWVMKKILIVEDVEMNRDLLVQLLEDDYELVEATDGKQGLEMAAQERPDLILLDISLPEMDGWEVTRRIRADEELKQIPIIAVTAHAMAGDEEKAYAQGCNGYLSKPIDEDELWAKVEKELG